MLECKISKYNFLKEAAKFVRDFQSFVNEADESLAKHRALELEIERLLRAVVSQDIMSIVQNNFVVDTSNLQTELEPYKDMQQKIKRLQAQLGDHKGNCKDTPCVSNTLDLLPQKLENENNKLHDTIYENAKLRAQLFDKVSKQKDTNKDTSVNTQFRKQSILGKPPSSSGPKLYSVTPLPKSKVLPSRYDSHDVDDRVGKSIRSFVRRIIQMEKIKLFHSSSAVNNTADASDNQGLFGNSGNTQCVLNDFSDTLTDFLSNGFMDLHGNTQRPTNCCFLRSHKAVKVRYIRSTIQPEPEGSTQEHSIRESRSPSEDWTFMDPVMQCTTLPSHSESLKRFLFHFSRRSTRCYRLSHSRRCDLEKVAAAQPTDYK
ncbi:hypothetical protein Tco_1404644 [Tanacetum coccineum]